MNRLGIVCIILFFVLGVLGMRAHPIWGDEAETALFARSILVHGIPYGWDGVNIMGDNNAANLSADLVARVVPWLPFYLAALSFGLLGESSLSARIPFFLVSLITIPLVYIVCKRVTGSRVTSGIAVLLVSTSVQFLLFSYQARYYSLSIFFGLLFFYSFLSLSTRGWWPKLLFVGSGIGFFYTNLVSFGFFFVSQPIAAGLAVWITGKSVREFFGLARTYLILGIVIVCAGVPSLLGSAVHTDRIAFGPVPIDGLGVFIREFYFAAVEPFVEGNVFPIVFWVFGIWVIVVKRRRLLAGHADTKRDSRLLYVLIVTIGIWSITMVGVTLATFLFDVRPPLGSFRIHTALLVLLLIADAIIIEDLYRTRRLLGGIVCVLFIGTNMFTLSLPVRSYLYDYIYETLFPYASPNWEVAQYLLKHADDGDTAFVNLDRDHDGLIFFLGKKIQFVNRIRPDHPLLEKNRHLGIPRNQYFTLAEPDWVILFSRREDDQSFLSFDWRPLPPVVNLADRYEKTVLPIYFSDTSRPEINLHSFYPTTSEASDQVFIYKRTKR